MIQPSDPELRPIAVRDGHSRACDVRVVWCRLAENGDAWFHFNPLGGRDARGCRIGCADAAHDATGRPIAVAV